MQSFDAKLRTWTSHVISALTDRVEVRGLSFESFKEVMGCLFDMNQQVLECKKDIRKSRELFDLGEEFFQIFRSIYGQQVLMLQKLQLWKSKLDNRLRIDRRWSQANNSALRYAFVFSLVIASPLLHKTSLMYCNAGASLPEGRSRATSTIIELGSDLQSCGAGSWNSRIELMKAILMKHQPVTKSFKV
ncbi:hypothetical protein CDL15_Pgr010494 [Punica granatum]|uniref:Uncharacterized protein n=1 Tax=Punica granatum TaxID=22663 RepID=A0A218XWQ0_PUNGR|nr:hypothetical protein CDL15_Pgr010494 [Punica granatum]